MSTIYRFIALLAFCGLLTQAHALSPDSVNILKLQADSAYANEDFETAQRLYHELAGEGENSALYYNLGCTYYRQDKIAQAVLWFERAMVLNPSDDDIRFNLAMARNKTVDRILPRHEMFFVSAWRTLIQSQSISVWAHCAIISFVIMLLLVSLYIFSSSVALRKTGFFGAIVCLLSCILFNTLAYQLRSHNTNHTYAVIMSPAVTVKSTPTKSGTDLFVLHEGTRVEIKDNSMKDWTEVQIADGKVGWVEKSSYEAI